MWARGREEPKDRSSGSPPMSLKLLCRNEWAEDEKLVFVRKRKVMEKLGCERLRTAGWGDPLKSPSAVRAVVLFRQKLMLWACSLGAWRAVNPSTGRHGPVCASGRATLEGYWDFCSSGKGSFQTVAASHLIFEACGSNPVVACVCSVQKVERGRLCRPYRSAWIRVLQGPCCLLPLFLLFFSRWALGKFLWHWINSWRPAKGPQSCSGQKLQLPAMCGGH